MGSIAKLTFVAAVAAVCMALPAFAQSFHGHGRTADQADKHAIRHLVHGRTVALQNGVNLFDMIPQSNPYDPALTGGGSIGYNQSLQRDQW